MNGPESSPPGGAARAAATRKSALDRPAARLVALAVFGLCAAALAWIHRDDLLPRAAAPVAADDPAARCFAARAAEIDKMLAEGVVDEARAQSFKARAEALCQDRHGQGAGPPPPPGQ